MQMQEVENTTFSGIGKNFGYVHHIALENGCPTDFRGQKIFKGEEYYAFDVGAGEEVYVHIEDVREYLADKRLDVECYDLLIKLIELYHDNYPVIM